MFVFNCYTNIIILFLIYQIYFEVFSNKFIYTKILVSPNPIVPKNITNAKLINCLSIANKPTINITTEVVIIVAIIIFVIDKTLFISFCFNVLYKDIIFFYSHNTFIKINLKLFLFFSCIYKI